LPTLTWLLGALERGRSDFTNAQSKFTAKIEMKDGAPVVTWSPALNGEGVREGTRVYRVWRKANLGDAAWTEVGAGDEGGYRFFRVTVEMP
jgi:ribosomal protein S5